MRDLDETDMEILSMLATDSRRPFSDIGEEIGLSGPAVSDRVTRLQEAGIINTFTIDVNRGALRAGVPVLIDLALPAASLTPAREQLQAADAVEHIFVTAASELRFYARVEAENVREWVTGLFDDIAIEGYTVTLVDDVEWTPTIDGVEFALTCAECGNTVDNEGETTRIDGEVYHFCCSSCLSRFEDRYQRFNSAA